MSGNYPDHVSYRDFDYSTATCPTCKGETDNFGPHHCDEDCRRGCRLQQAEDCDDCASACIGCGEKGCKKDRGVCQACKDNAAEFDIPHLLNCEVKLKAAEAEVEKLEAYAKEKVQQIVEERAASHRTETADLEKIRTLEERVRVLEGAIRTHKAKIEAGREDAMDIDFALWEVLVQPQQKEGPQ